VVIAIALALSPKLLIADEPTTALDVTTQAQILSLIRDLQRQRGMGLLFITHDLGVVADIADRIVVMEKGRAVETGLAKQVLHTPKHVYTQRLIQAVPALQPPTRQLSVSEELLSVRNLTKSYAARTGLFGGRRTVKAVDQVSFSIGKGKTLGLVGESGSGKSTVGRLVLKLIAADSGEVRVGITDVLKLGSSGLHAYRRRAQMVFQDPFGSLNPRRRVVSIIADGPVTHGVPRSEAVARALSLLEAVGLSREMGSRLPHEFSGGQRQRIAIARALALEPELIVADEPVSALDVSVQAQILDLFKELKRRMSLTMLFITHDLRVAAQMCDEIAVMHRGSIVEQGPASQVLTEPRHVYTRSLLAAVPGRQPVQGVGTDLQSSSTV
jgi:peptide/nickel transport system ATP-binding protein